MEAERTLSRWLQSNGVKIDRLEPFDFPDTGRGLRAKTTINAGEPIISLPQKLLFGTVTALESPLGPGIRRHQSAFSKASDVLALTLLFYRYGLQDEFWHPFIKTLPITFTSLLMWPEDKIARLGNRSLFLRMQKKFSVLKHRFSSIQAVLSDILPQETSNGVVKPSSWFTFDNFKWAHACIASRSIYYDGTRAIAQKSQTLGRISFVKDTAVLAPFLDLLNHSDRASCSAVVDQASGAYTMVTNRKIEAGSQAFIHYGSHSNDTLLQHYGFVIEDNINDAVRLDALHDQLSDLFVSPGSGSDPRVEFLTTNRLHPQNLMKQPLVLVADPESIPWSTTTVAKILALNRDDPGLGDACQNVLLEEVVSDEHERNWRGILCDAISSSLQELQSASDLAEDNAVFRTLIERYSHQRRKLLQNHLQIFQAVS